MQAGYAALCCAACPVRYVMRRRSLSGGWRRKRTISRHFLPCACPFGKKRAKVAQRQVPHGARTGGLRRRKGILQAVPGHVDNSHHQIVKETSRSPGFKIIFMAATNDNLAVKALKVYLDTLCRFHLRSAEISSLLIIIVRARQHFCCRPFIIACLQKAGGLSTAARAHALTVDWLTGYIPSLFKLLCQRNADS